MYRSNEIRAPGDPTAPRSNGASPVDPDRSTAGDSVEGFTEISPSPKVVELATLLRFDMISVRTANSHYRLFLLDPHTGRALLEGGGKIREPIEVRVIGSSFGGILLKTGCICVGLRLEVCTNNHYIRTSPVRSLRVENRTSPELTSSLSQ